MKAQKIERMRVRQAFNICADFLYSAKIIVETGDDRYTQANVRTNSAQTAQVFKYPFIIYSAAAPVLLRADRFDII